MTQPGLWFDGKTAAERPVDVFADPAGLLLVERSGGRHSVDAADLVRLGAARDQSRFGHRSVEGWRLVLHEPVDPEIRRILPRSVGSLSPGLSKRTMGILMGVCGGLTALAGLVIFAPEVVAARMPISWERKLGSAYELPIASMRCSNAQGQAALDALVDRIDPAAREDGFTLELVTLNVTNAVALPGGRMVLFKGLLNEIDDPDAIAGIVAHEIAHVRERHVAAAMVRQMGLGTVVALMGGGAVAGSAGDLMSLKFSRGAEAEADSQAIALLAQAGIDPRPTAVQFKRFAREADEGSGFDAEFLQSHPLSTARARRFQQAFRKGTNYRKALTADQYRSLTSAC